MKFSIRERAETCVESRWEFGHAGAVPVQRECDSWGGGSMHSPVASSNCLCVDFGDRCELLSLRSKVRSQAVRNTRLRSNESPRLLRRLGALSLQELGTVHVALRIGEPAQGHRLPVLDQERGLNRAGRDHGSIEGHLARGCHRSCELGSAPFLVMRAHAAWQ